MNSTGKCQETSGFLFKHACAFLADATCEICQKSICNRHLRRREEQVVCTSCAKKALRRTEDYRKERRFGRDSNYSSDDPYFYGGYHYPGFGYYGIGYWGHDHHHHIAHHDATDFTEGDAHSLVEEGDEGFEDDLGES